MEDKPLFKTTYKFFRKCQQSILQSMSMIKHFSVERPDLASVIDQVIAAFTSLVTAIIPQEIAWDVN
jgi:hypothetical protein